MDPNYATLGFVLLGLGLIFLVGEMFLPVDLRDVLLLRSAAVDQFGKRLRRSDDRRRMRLEHPEEIAGARQEALEPIEHSFPRRVFDWINGCNLHRQRPDDRS